MAKTKKNSKINQYSDKDLKMFKEVIEGKLKREREIGRASCRERV